MFRRLLTAVGLSSPDTTATTAVAPEHSASAIVAETVSGSHVLTIHGYSQTKELIRNGQCVRSGAFTVAGHRCVIDYYPNGESPATADWVSIYLKLERRSTDVKAQVKLGLLDKDGEPVPTYWYPKNPDQVCSYTVDGEGWGTHRFIERKALEASDYLVKEDDCFRVRFDVVVFKEIRTEKRDADDAACRASSIVALPPDLGRHLGRLLSGWEGADVVRICTTSRCGSSGS
ncbi:hypothetical protein EJB05_26585, partial [Eragrostis curvula]